MYVLDVRLDGAADLGDSSSTCENREFSLVTVLSVKRRSITRRVNASSYSAVFLYRDRN